MKHVMISQLDDETKLVIKTKLLDILKCVVSICENNNLRYFLSYGSCLGAVRHGGMIPWDSDIDVCMPRPDWNKFVEFCLNNDIGRFELYTPKNTPGYFEHYARVGDKQTTKLQSIYMPCEMGLYVDIHPIDGVKDVVVAKRRFRLFRILEIIHHLSNSDFPVSERWRMIKCGRIPLAIGLSLLYINRRFCSECSLKLLHRIMEKESFDDGKYAVSYLGIYGYKNIFPINWVKDFTKMKFEDLMVNVPLDYDSYLKNYYGDYMTPPPVEKRDDRHVLDYLNLKERVSVDVIKNMFRYGN